MAALIYGEDTLARNTPLNTKAMVGPPEPRSTADGGRTASVGPASGLDRLLARQ
jgi:hypothetical protein